LNCFFYYSIGGIQTTNQSKAQPMTTSPMNMNELLNQLKTSKDNVANVVIHKLNDNVRHVLKILETCDIDTLKDLKQYMVNDNRHIYDKIMERRMDYVNRVRRQYQSEMRKNEKDGIKNEKIQDNFIHFRGDPDDTHNLSCGVSVISSGIEKINKIIERKQQAIDDEIQKQNNPFNILMSFIFQ
jgi:hypothetical protein